MKTIAQKITQQQKLITSLLFLIGGAYLMFLLQNTLHLQNVFSVKIDWLYYIAFFVVLFVSSFVSGLSGFGFSAIGASLLLFLQPTSAVALLVLLSLFTQLLSVNKLWKEISPHMTFKMNETSVLPYIIGGFVGIPLGVYVLSNTDPKRLTAILGGILVVYALYSLVKPATWILKEQKGWFKSSIVGALGGLVGGFSAFPGSAVVIWTGLQSIQKEKVRAITQPYIIAMQIISLVCLLLNNHKIFDSCLLTMFALSVPIVYMGNSYGIKCFQTINQFLFRRITFILLGLSGLVLLIKTML